MSKGQFTDWHTHLYLPEHVGQVWTDRGTELVGVPAFGVADYATHEAAMKANAVDRFAVVGLQIAHMGTFIPNEYLGEYMHRHRERCIGIGSVDPTQPGAAQALRTAVKEWGLHGVKLSPPYQGFHPHSDEAYEVYRAAADLGLFIMFHQASVFAPDGFLEFASPSLIDKVARDFRSTKIILAHFGKPWMNEVVELMMKNRNVYADVSAQMLKPWQIYSGLRMAMELNVTGRLLYGSDFPFVDPALSLQKLYNVCDLDMPLPIPRSLIDDIVYNRPFELII